MSRDVTDRVLSQLRDRGVEVVDHRGSLPLHPKGYRYGQVSGGIRGVRYLVQHWTGDAFSRSTLKTITGTDYDTITIPDTMSLEDEVYLVHWYHQLHQGNDGGIWPGIAYGMLVFPSGRLHVCWDLGTQTYHAFNANALSYAISCPNSHAAPPTNPQLVALNHLWDVLCNHTPELPAGHQDLFGHNEMGFIDARNNGTACPGTFLQHVRQFRETGEPTVDLKQDDPNKIYFEETGHWLAYGFRGFWESQGGLSKFGYPISEEYPNEQGVTVQWFQRCRMEHQPDIADNPWGVVLGLVGNEASAAAREQHPDAFRRREQ